MLSWSELTASAILEVYYSIKLAVISKEEENVLFRAVTTALCIV